MSRNVMIVLVVVVVALLFGFGLWIFTATEQEHVEVPVQVRNAQPDPRESEPVVVAEGKGTFENPFPLGKIVEKQAEPGIVHRVTVMEAWIEESLWHNKLYVTLKIEIIGPPGKFSQFESRHFAVLGLKGTLENVHFIEADWGPRILTGTEKVDTIWTLIDSDDSGHILIWDREIWKISPKPVPRYFFELIAEIRG